jgi:hypothetical protein
MTLNKMISKDFIKSFIVFIFFTFPFLNGANAQNITKIVRVVSGGTVSFNFKSLTEYTSGKILSNWSRLSIQYRDTSNTGGDGTSIGWRILVRSGSATIQSDGAAPDLPLSTIQIKPTTSIPGTTVNNITLSAADQIIVEGVDPGALEVTGEIYLTYECGTVTPLIRQQPDYYFVDLIFTLVEINP